MKDALRVLVTGAAGQVGRALLASVPVGFEARGATHASLDIADAEQVERQVAEFGPDVIVNAAAYTAVDKAEGEQATAARVNVDGVTHLARAALAHGARLIHVSTDFVFDGRGCAPYRPSDPAAPLSVYGATKLAGERQALSILGEQALIVRTAWLYAAEGRNFLTTMLRLMRERAQVRVVDDQIGTPTAAASVASVLWSFARTPRLSGIFHWSDAGVASWYDFAVAIAEEGAQRGLLPSAVEVKPIATAEYPTAARRPAYSVLDKRSTMLALGCEPPHWRSTLRSVMEELSRA